jgi:hypothetical protein
LYLKSVGVKAESRLGATSTKQISDNGISSHHIACVSASREPLLKRWKWVFTELRLSSENFAALVAYAITLLPMVLPSQLFVVSDDQILHGSHHLLLD